MCIRDSNSTTYSDWTPFNKTELVIEPNQGYGVDVDGVWCGHDWNEDSGGQPYNTPRMYWRYNVSLPFDMTDYIITNAFFYAIINATVNQDIDTEGDSQARWSPNYPLNQHVIYDYAEFYVEISDLNIEAANTFNIGYNRTVTLGNDDPPGEYEIEGLIDPKTTQAIIDAINNVLAVDPGHDNFTMVLGIYMYCEDNYGGNDRDQWEDLRFKELNLTFSYAKKIDESAALSWEQVGDELTGANIDIINATLNFKYNIDKNWTASSRNSEFRILINNRQHTETIKLSNANSTFQDIKPGGLDVSALILKNVNITVSIQVYMANTFALDQKYIISIDNASLSISYSKTTIEETTSLDILLNSQNTTYIEVKMGYTVNITVIYKDLLNTFIQNATVQLIGLGSPKDLSENDVLERYNITIHTSNLFLGNNYLTISASKKYYELKSVMIIIKVIARETELQLYLDKTDKTLDKSIQMIYGNSGNITITYKDKEILPSVHIDGATVELTGLGTPINMTEDPIRLQYYKIIDTRDLGLGNTYLTVNAEKDNYTSQSIRFKIEVLERNSYIDKIFLNKIEANVIEIPWNINLNIAMEYKDTFTDNLINDSLVQLTGTGILENFTENSPLNYSLDINSRKLKLGINFLTISAQKDNYSLSTRIITVSVLERETYLEIYINNSKYLTSQFYNTSVGEFLNITVFYNDLDSDSFIDLASVQLIESGKLYDVNESLFFDFYSITLEMENLGAGVKFLTITAKKDNYTLSTTLITLMIEEKETTILLFINGTQYFDGETIEAEINDKLNVTVKYLDNITQTFLSSAAIELIGEGFLDENILLEYYNITINVLDLAKQFNRLSIRAQLENYQFALIEFYVQVVERESVGTLFLNTLNKTTNPYLELPIRSLVNFTVKFIDGKTGNHIPGATIRIDGDLTDVLDEDSDLELYYLIVNTTQLSIGINVFSIIAERPNFQPFIIQNIYINIRRISTNITTVSGETTISTTPGKSITLSIVLYDLDFGGMIKGASVTYRWQYGQADLTDPENDGIYEAVITDVPVGSFVITVYAYSGDHYNFEPYEIVLSVIRPKENNLWWLWLLIGVSIAAGILTTYLIVYMRILRFPKAVRKVRKYRKSLKRKAAPSVSIINREKAFNSIYHEELSKTSSTIKVKPPVPKKKPTQKKEAGITPPIKDKPIPSE